MKILGDIAFIVCSVACLVIFFYSCWQVMSGFTEKNSNKDDK